MDGCDRGDRAEKGPEWVCIGVSYSEPGKGECKASLRSRVIEGHEIYGVRGKAR